MSKRFEVEVVEIPGLEPGVVYLVPSVNSLNELFEMIEENKRLVAKLTGILDVTKVKADE